MGKTKWWSVMVTGILLLLLSAFLGTVAWRGHRMAVRGALTLAELSTLAANWERAPGAWPASTSDAQSAAGPESLGEHAAPPTLVAAFGLERCQREWGNPDWAPGWWVERLGYNSGASATWLLRTGTTGQSYLEAGRAAEARRDFEKAALYYREALHHPLGHVERRECCMHLAWYEEDPRVAERLLETACSGDEPERLDAAARLAFQTDSEALYEHYLGRLRRLAPVNAAVLSKALKRRRSESEPSAAVVSQNVDTP